MNSLYSIAWLTNLRGNDIEYTPLIFCNVIIPKKGKIELFVNLKKVKSNLEYLIHFSKINDFNNLEKFIKNIDLKSSIGFDEHETSFYYKDVCNILNLKTVNLQNPCLYLKATKNQTELKQLLIILRI